MCACVCVCVVSVCMLMCVCVCHIAPNFRGASFSRFSRIGLGPRKVSLRNVSLYTYACIRSSLGPQNLFPRDVQYDQTVKIMRLETLALYSMCVCEYGVSVCVCVCVYVRL